MEPHKPVARPSLYDAQLFLMHLGQEKRISKPELLMSALESAIQPNTWSIQSVR